MIDMHYDLLTKVRMCSLDGSNFLDEWIKNYNENNVRGLIANLCFESLDEMKEEYNPDYYHESDSVLEIFKDSVERCKKILPSNINCYFGIEGADYIKNTDELCKLYEVGLRCINIVWNEPNKYGSGVRDNYGLTEEGKEFVKKCFELNIGVDLSHANEVTFYDVVSLAKENKYLNPVVYASHSNSFELCDLKRNLTDEQLEALKSINGYVGVFSNRNFVHRRALREQIDGVTLRKEYMNHIEHIGNIIGYNHVMLSTDDMGFSLGDDDFPLLPIYDYKNIREEVEKDLMTRFSEDKVRQIMFENSEKLFSKLDENVELDKDDDMKLSLTK